MIDNMVKPFHLAIPIFDINIAKTWYVNILNCKVGRSSENWIDFDFFGHQLVGHLVNNNVNEVLSNKVDGEDVPSRHFGVIVDILEWNELVDHLKLNNISFIVNPQQRFLGKIGSQYTFFINDPFGNAIEFKAFINNNEIFAK